MNIVRSDSNDGVFYRSPRQRWIISEQAASGSARSEAGGRLTLKVFPGSIGSFDLYSDSGAGLGYTRRQYATTSITDSFEPATPSGAGTGASSRVDVQIGAARGRHPGKPHFVTNETDVVDLTKPSQVTLNGRPLPEADSAPGVSGWHYEASTNTVVVDTTSLSMNRATNLVLFGPNLVNPPEPASSS